MDEKTRTQARRALGRRATYDSRTTPEDANLYSLNGPCDTFEMTLRQAIPIIIERFTQLPITRIVVFGSVARGSETSDSDLNLAVVVPEPAAGTSIDRVAIAVELRRMVVEINAEIAMDILVYTENEFERLSGIGGFVRTESIDGGETVYERAG